MIAERHFKNEDCIKEKIVTGRRNGVCDSNGASVKVTDAFGNKVYIAKPRFRPSSAVKTYVCRQGKMVLKE